MGLEPKKTVSKLKRPMKIFLSKEIKSLSFKYNIFILTLLFLWDMFYFCYFLFSIFIFFSLKFLPFYNWSYLISQFSSILWIYLLYFLLDGAKFPFSYVIWIFSKVFSLFLGILFLLLPFFTILSVNLSLWFSCIISY